MTSEYKLRVCRFENYSGEHREWIEEIVLPEALVKQIQADAIARESGSDASNAGSTALAVTAACLRASEQRLCEGCPPDGYPTDETRCSPCPRRSLPQPNVSAEGG